MAAGTLESKKLNLMQLILSINQEKVIDKLSDYIKRVNKSNACNDSLMSEEDFYQKIDESMAQIERGESIAMADDESVEDFLARL